MANSYDIGDLVRCTATFANSFGAAIDPASVIARVRKPDNTVTSYTYGTDIALIKTATGIYYIDVSVTTHGTWRYRFEGVGSGQCAHESYFSALQSSFV